ncbi:MAG TPA: M1 family aminopeptidase [Flavipsychrobacter sp.]|nr:M1 family aminopeptidase [Flavipsychrobacter sp.]
MKYFFPLAIVSFCLLFSCSNFKKTTKRKDQTQYVSLDTVKITAKKADTIYRGSAPRIWDITHTKVALSFNMQEKTADSKAWIDLHPYFYATDTLVLDAKSMRIDAVELVTNSGNHPLTYIYKGDSLKIWLNKVYQARDSIQLYIAYTAMPYASQTGGSAAITDDRGLYFINTDYSIPGKPAQIWTQGETESNSHWMPTIDKPNERMTTEIELTVPDSFVTLSNGYMTRHIQLKNGMRKDIWKMDLPIQTYAIMFAIGKFSIIKDHWRDKEVSYYVEPEYAPYASKMFNNTPEMIEYFSKITGIPYPWNKYAQVVVRDYVSGAMENTGASLFGEFMNQNAREIADRNFEDVVSHELFHQWFGDYVTCESWSNITLNESFADYSEKLWRRYKYGDASADKQADDALHKYLNYAESTDQPLVRFYYNDREAVFDPTSYEKGGAILYYLNELMGDDAFHKAMNIYLTKNALSSAEATQWRLAIEQATGLDWNWFFNEFYYHGGHPSLNVQYNYNDSAQQLVVTVQQTNADSQYKYQLPLKTAVIYGNNKEMVNWDINNKIQTYTYSYKNGMRPVIVPDALHWLPGSIKDDKKLQQWFVQFNNCNDYISKRKAVAAAYQAQNDSLATIIFHKGLKDDIYEIREYSLKLLGYIKDTTKWKKEFVNEVEWMVNNDKNNNVRAAAYNLLGNWDVRINARDLQQAIYDSSYSIAGAALYDLSIVDSDKAYDLAKQLLLTHPEAELKANIWNLIGKRGKSADVSLFEKEADYVYGAKKFQFAYGLYTYLLNVQNDSSFKRGLNVFTQLMDNEGVKTYKSGLASYVFSLAKVYKGRAESNDKESYETIHATIRYPVIKSYIKHMMDTEKDENILKKYKTQNDELNSSGSGN